MVTFCSLPVPRSLARTLRMPLASMSKVTSICGIPRGAGAMRLFAVRELLDQLLDGGHPRCATDQDDLIELGGRELRVLERGVEGGDRLFGQVRGQLLELGA